VLNTLTGHDFQDALTKWQEHWERCIRAEECCFEGDGGQKAQSQFLIRRQHQSRELWTALCIVMACQAMIDRTIFLLFTGEETVLPEEK
jgi:hypothetical protein